MNCVRNSYLGPMLYARTFFWLCSSWGLLHRHYLDDTAAQVLPALTRFQQSIHNYPWNREGPFIPRKKCLMRKVTTITGPGSSGAAKHHITSHTPGSAGAVPNSPDKGGAAVAPGFPQAGGLCARPARAARGPMAEAAAEAPNEGRIARKGTGGRLRDGGDGVFAGVPIISQSQLTASLPAPFTVFYCPTGTKNRKWNGNNWNTRYDASSGKFPAPWLELPVHL